MSSLPDFTYLTRCWPLLEASVSSTRVPGTFVLLKRPDAAPAAGGELGFLTIWSGAYDHERIVAQDAEIFGRLVGTGAAAETPQQSYRTLVPLIRRQ